jgi:hypothetical protein
MDKKTVAVAVIGVLVGVALANKLRSLPVVDKLPQL